MLTTRRDALKTGLACSLWLTPLACSSSRPAPSASAAGGRASNAPAWRALGFMPTEPIQPISGPFAMPQLQRPRIPERVFDVRDFGAVADGTTKITAAIAQAIVRGEDVPHMRHRDAGRIRSLHQQELFPAVQVRHPVVRPGVRVRRAGGRLRLQDEACGAIGHGRFERPGPLVRARRQRLHGRTGARRAQVARRQRVHTRLERMRLGRHQAGSHCFAILSASSRSVSASLKANSRSRAWAKEWRAT